MGEPRDPRSYTPRHLVDRILGNRAAMLGERKRVTVMFVDIRDSLELSSRVDPEAWHDILDGFFRLLADAVHGYEGTINQFTGDGIMALFGAPLAHEEHARRACLAALEIQRRLGPFAADVKRAHGLDLGVRIGLNSGDVVVAAIGDDLRMDYTAQGHTVGLAARLERLCEPGRAYLSADTADLVRGYFELADCGEHVVKGAEAPVHAFALVRETSAGSRLEATRGRGWSPYVDHETELTRLDDVLARARVGRGAIVGVEGEAGVGKSRLCQEFLARHAVGVVAHRVQCTPYGDAQPLGAVGQWVRSLCGMDAAAPASAATVQQRLAALELGDADDAPVIAELLRADGAQVRLGAEARQRRLLRVLKRALARPEPSILYVDDLHWIDASSADTLAELADDIAASPTMVLTNFRPGLSMPLTEASCFTHLHLTPLDVAEAERMVAERMRDDGGRIARYIHARTAGNPLFIEELLRAVSERVALGEAPPDPERLEALAIPDSVHDLLASRIDRLPQEDKRVLQAAAIVGVEFDVDLLGAATRGGVLAPSLQRLEHAGFLAELGSDGARYRFRHPLMQEVAHDMQLRRQRQGAHHAVAEVLLERSGTDVDAARISLHYEQAGERLAAARFAASAARHESTTDPRQGFDQLLRLASLSDGLDDPEGRKLQLVACVQLLGIGWRHGLSLERARDLFERGYKLATDTDQPRMLAALHSSYGRLLGFGLHTDAYVDHVREALRIAEQGDSELAIATAALLSQALRSAGYLREGLELGETLIARLGDDPNVRIRGLDFSPVLWLRTMRGQTLRALGELDRAEDELRQCMSVAEELDAVELWITAVYVLADLCWLRGDVGDLDALSQRAVTMAEDRASSYAVFMAQIARGVALLLSGDGAAARAHFEWELARARQRGTARDLEPTVLDYLSSLARADGDREAALCYSREAVAQAELRRARYMHARGLLGLADALVGSSDEAERAEREQALERAAELIDQMDAGALRPALLAARR